MNRTDRRKQIIRKQRINDSIKLMATEGTDRSRLRRTEQTDSIELMNRTQNEREKVVINDRNL